MVTEATGSAGVGFVASGVSVAFVNSSSDGRNIFVGRGVSVAFASASSIDGSGVFVGGGVSVAFGPIASGTNTGSGDIASRLNTAAINSGSAMFLAPFAGSCYGNLRSKRDLFNFLGGVCVY